MQVEDKMLERVRSLIEKAEHPSTPPPEAALAREMADSLMFKYAIDRASLSASRPKADRPKPSAITIRLCDYGNPLETQFSMLSVAVAEHTRCLTVLLPGWGNSPTRVRVFGFDSDLEFFQIMFTTLLLHMSGIFFPRPQGDISLEENLLRLRTLGLNWLQMAEVYGWKKTGRKIDGDKIEYINANGERRTNWQLGSFYKRTTHRAARNAGIKLEVIQAGTSRKHAGDNWRRSAATGYVVEISVRLEAARGKREVGADLVLASEHDAIKNLKDQEFPHTVPVEGEEYKFSGDAYLKGLEHARTADISGAVRVAGREREAIK